MAHAVQFLRFVCTNGFVFRFFRIYRRADCGVVIHGLRWDGGTFERAIQGAGSVAAPRSSESASRADGRYLCARHPAALRAIPGPPGISDRSRSVDRHRRRAAPEGHGDRGTRELSIRRASPHARRRSCCSVGLPRNCNRGHRVARIERSVRSAKLASRPRRDHDVHLRGAGADLRLGYGTNGDRRRVVYRWSCCVEPQRRVAPCRRSSDCSAV